METESRGNEVDRETRKLLFDVNVARARTAWDTKELNVAIALLNRCKKGTEDSATRYLSLANQYLLFGKSLCRWRDKNEEEKRSGDGGNDDGEALRMMNEALELCERGLRVVKRREEAVSFKELRDKTLRFVAAVNLNKEEFESVIKCVRVLRENSCDQHPSLSVLAMKGWLGLGRFGEAEKELRGMVVENGIPEGIWVTAVEAYFKTVGVAGVETVRSVFMGLLGRCSVSAAAAIRVVCKVVGDGGNDAGGEGEKVRASLAAELAADERVVALFVGDRRGKERTNMHAVLWNYAAAYFKTKDYKISAELFEKAMLYVPSGMESRILRAKGFRVLSLCHLGLSQLDQAQEYIDEADKLEPNIACAFLKFKIFLQNNNHDAAISQVQAMMSCTDFTTDFLSLAAHEAVACAANPVAVAALSNLLNFYSSGKMMPISEVVVLRTVVTILLQKPDNEQDALIFMKKAQARMAELGPDKFFGKKEVGRRERSWFATTAWNNGTRTGEAKIYDLCTEYFMLASDFYGVVMEGEVEGNDPMVCKSIILSVSAMIAAEKQNKVAFVDAEVKHTIEMLDKARKMLASISTVDKLLDSQDGKTDANHHFIYTFNAYELYGRLKDSGSQQLAVKSFANSKACNPKYLLQIGLTASEGPLFNSEVATYALNASLTHLFASPTPDYQNIAMIIRRLITVSVACKNNFDDEDAAVYALYRQAYRIMVGLKEGEYPVEEGKWLATTAWNRASVPVRLGQVDSGKKWMTLGLELARNVPGMETYRASMEDYIAGFEKNSCKDVKQELKPMVTD
ncbi:hypothetical protein Droror1_Dr00008359 [Drosera rotundifolia]